MASNTDIICNYFAHFHTGGFTNQLCATIDYGFKQTFNNASDTHIICNHFAHTGGFLHQCCTIVDNGFKQTFYSIHDHAL